MDEAIALVVLGQVMTSQATAGQYKAEVQNQVKDDIVKADADLICSSFNNTVIKWLTKWNFPSANPPKLWLLTKDEADELKQTRAWANMAAVGYRPTIKMVEKSLGGEWEAIEPKAIGASINANPDDFAEENAPSMVDDLIDQLSDEVDPIINDWLMAIKKALDDADSMESLRDALDSLAETLSFEDYARVFEQANITAKLAGMQSVTDEAHG